MILCKTPRQSVMLNINQIKVKESQMMVKKVIMNLDLSEASGPDCIPVLVLKN